MLVPKLSEYLKTIVRGRKRRRPPPQEVEELRRTFQTRYHHFKLLLNANNKALEMMGDMEQALRGGQPFGMSFVKSASTAVSVSVMQIIRNLEALAPGRYYQLPDRFKEVQEKINSVLVAEKVFRGGRLVVTLDQVDKNMADEVGSKMANLGEILSHLNLAVPPGFIISSAAYERFMERNDLQAEIDRLLQATQAEEVDQLHALSAAVEQLVIRSRVPEDLEQAIMEAYGRLEAQAGKGVRVSMRSSALGEDIAGTSFAGQYRSQLNVSAENLVQAYKEIVASKYTLQAIHYRFNRGIRDEDVAMCVGCMAMVNPIAGGVTYSSNPVAPQEDSIVINSVWGLPKAVVDGSARSDLFVVSRQEPLKLLRKEIQIKDRKLVCDAEEGLSRVSVAEPQSTSPSLADDQVLKLAAMALRLEKHYGSPQDVEWAIAPDETIYVLQCRPLIPIKGAQEWRQRLAGGPANEPALLAGGVTASPGAASGPVFRVRRNADILQFPSGAILVAAQPLPSWASLLSRAAAVVAEQGSVTGHLASVAREFGLPALFGLTGAVEALKDGTVITVDADGCRVLEGRVESLLGSQAPKTNLMQGSPVYEALQAVSKHILPLNLVDPDAPEFKPDRCRTFHDITRYAHEKSVQEMFQFGKEQHFPERASKQLVCNVPMQLWVINLDDGFHEEVNRRYVELSNITSIPMLALWEGMTAIPWQGPPPLNVRGLLSVMFEATVNPNLNPGSDTSYTDRNYFMISRNFCSLQSRFGFHFSTVETLASERSLENYISFQFMGGAADYQRKHARAVFIGSILEEQGFRVEVKGDALFARLEGYDEEVMKEKLRVLGYLIIHTRQLDMIMSDGASINTYRERIVNDLKSLCPMSGSSRNNSVSSAH
jgi:pyruvate,water dikinase